MATRRCIEASSWVSKPICSKDVQLHICGVPFTLGRELLAARSAKLAELLKLNPQEDLSHLLEDIPADPKTFELVGRFCHGYEVNITAENVVRVCCLASFLEMTEDHSTNNLLKMALTFFKQKVIPSWNKSVRALRTTESILQPASKLGLVDACADSIITKALTNPHFLGEPVKILTFDDDGEDNENTHRPNARRQLFVLDWKYEDLTTLSLQLYEPIIRSMIQRQVSSEYVAASICQYAKTRIFCTAAIGDDMPISKKHDQREAIEAVQRLLPHERGLIPCTLLFEMLRLAIALEASLECRNGFEIRIGKQLDQATVKDLLIPSHGYAKELQYDTECVKKILKIFYCNYTSPDVSGLITVAELVEDFLAEVASDIDLKMSTFISVAEMSIAASAGTQRRSDGIYRAIAIYLDKHRYLTESEKEEVCRVLDCNKMTPEACEHAAQNDRLPLRVVVQVLFVGQLQIRDTIAKEVQGSDDGIRKSEEQLEEETARIGSSEDEVRTEIEKMGSKVLELEKECYMMRTGIQSNCCSRAKKEKVGMWKEMKRKFGCITSMHDCNCHVKKKKKVHPR
ncbi:hypothetical protein RJ639_016392 [Escallonia herrerae]|uniref:Phototropic-responsive NPH3 family protein n=1 Tax=Escallonia herrerae TaxID=1293975 RepID=A0AA88VDW4_9ASTE|nr:hypothetical protein RJ639_016392 [Escallonia herrerae]